MTPPKKPLFVAPPIFQANGVPVLQRVMVANRGEIACRVMRTCKQLMMTTIAVYADEDESSPHTKMADEAICIGPADQQPYQSIQNLVHVAKLANADAIHPGYGYLSENADFARAVAAAGLVFVGPTPESITKLGDKRTAKEYLGKHSSVPLIPGYGGLTQDPALLEAEADRIGYPILIKASAGGGGRGMRIVQEKSEFLEAFRRCASEAERAFGSSHCLVEKYIQSGKHVEIQVVGDGETFVSFLDRECSIQRRHQKIIEESPCPWLSAEMRQRISDAAIEIARLLKYVSAGTVEFIVDIQQETFYFLEVNTRIQVEHPITEAVMGVDLVALQLFVAADGKLASLRELDNLKQIGHAIEVRLCAEDPFNKFLPCTGTVAAFKTVSQAVGVEIANVRYDAGVTSGSNVSVHFDSMICKVIVWAADRTSAIHKMSYVLRNTVCTGVTTNHLFLQRILAHSDFQSPDYTTSFIETHETDLLKPESLGHAVGPMMMAAVISNSQLRKANSSSSSLFGSIPNGFRNQRKDVKSSARDYVSCQLQLLAHDASGEFMVTHVAQDEYEVAELKPTPVLTDADKKQLFNKQGGVLTKRFYHAAQSEVTSRLTVRILHAGEFLSGQGELRLSIGNEQHSFFVSLLSNDDHKRVMSVYSTQVGYGVNYAISDPLSWAGKFELRIAGQGLGSSDAQIKYLSPMPCHILQILVSDGTTVKRGEGLLVIESMKTEIRINAEAPGIVRMHVEKGSKISEGVVMCEVVAAEPESVLD